MTWYGTCYFINEEMMILRDGGVDRPCGSTPPLGQQKEEVSHGKND